MKNKKTSKIIAAAVVAVLVIVGIFYAVNQNKGADTIYDSKVTEVIAFGDSFTDNGGSYEASKKALENKDLPKDAAILPAELDSDLYWEGRWSNGNTAAEVLAEDLKVEIKDYAVGGAFSGNNNYYDWLNKYVDTGVLAQIDKYKEEAKDGKADEDALYFLMSSANDLFYHYDYAVKGDVTKLADNAVDNQIKAVKKLANMGGEHFLVAGAGKWQDEPWCISSGYAKDAKIFTDEYNKEIKTKLVALEKELKADGKDVQIEFFDYTEAQTDLQKNADKYGIKELKTPYQYTYPKHKVNDTDADECYFWDEWHPTKVVHKAMGDKMAAQVTK